MMAKRNIEAMDAVAVRGRGFIMVNYLCCAAYNMLCVCNMPCVVCLLNWVICRFSGHGVGRERGEKE